MAHQNAREPAKYCLPLPACYSRTVAKGLRRTGCVAPEREKQMPKRLPKVVLVLIVLMAVCSPFMQLDSWDNFPVGTGDIEMHMISVLFETGMFFVFAGILNLF